MADHFARAHLLLYHEHVNQDDIVHALTSHKAVRRWALCFHDKDENMKPHYHVLLDFGRSYDTTRITGWFPQHPGIKESRLIEPIKSWTAMVQYLIHKNDQDKHQYPASAIISSYDIEEDLTGPTNKPPAWFGQFGQEDYFRHLTWIDQNVHNIFQANKLYQQVKTRYELYLRAQEGSERDMKVIYVEGPPRVGKSTFARWWAKSRNLSYFISSSSNDPLDGYAGQAVLILDDLRDNVFSLTDLLKILDNHGGSSIRSRYNNKVFTGKYVLITCIHPLSQWYRGPESKVGEEPLQQLYGRVNAYVELRANKTATLYDKVNKDTGVPVENLLTDDQPFHIEDYINQTDALEDDIIGDTLALMKGMQPKS
jgi:hypothetical protein